MFGKAQKRDLSRALSRVETLEEALKSLSGLATELARVTSALARVEGLQGNLADRLDEMVGWKKEISLAVAEGIEKVDRAERRVKATVQRARQEFKKRGFESPALDAEADDLREVHAGGSQPSRVPEVPAPVAGLRKTLRKLGVSR